MNDLWLDRKYILNAMNEIKKLSYGKEESFNLLEQYLDGINRLNYSSHFLHDQMVDELITILINVVPLTNENLIIKFCWVILNTLNKQKLILAKSAYNAAEYLLNALKRYQSCPSTIIIILRGLATVTFQNVHQLTQLSAWYIETILQCISFDETISRSALQCLENITFRPNIEGEYLDDSLQLQCLQFVLNFLRGSKPEKIDEVTYCRTLISALQLLSNLLLAMQPFPINYISPMISTIQVYILYDHIEFFPTYLSEIQNTLTSVPIDDVIEKISAKKKRSKRKQKKLTNIQPSINLDSDEDQEEMKYFDNIKNSSNLINMQGIDSFWDSIQRSDSSECSDVENIKSHGEHHIKIRAETAKVRLQALLCLHSAIKIVEKKTMFGYWTTFFQDNSFNVSNQSNYKPLLHVVMKDQSFKVRAACLNVIASLLDDSKSMLVAAEESIPYGTIMAFTPFSVTLGTILKELHHCLLLLIAPSMTNGTILLQAIKCLTKLVENCPYSKLRPGLLTTVVKHVRLHIPHRDSNIRTVCLTCLASIVSIQPISFEISQLLQPYSNSHTPSIGGDSNFSQIMGNSLTNEKSAFGLCGESSLKVDEDIWNVFKQSSLLEEYKSWDVGLTKSLSVLKHDNIPQKQINIGLFNEKRNNNVLSNIAVNDDYQKNNESVDTSYLKFSQYDFFVNNNNKKEEETNSINLPDLKVISTIDSYSNDISSLPEVLQDNIGLNTPTNSKINENILNKNLCTKIYDINIDDKLVNNKTNYNIINNSTSSNINKASADSSVNLGIQGSCINENSFLNNQASLFEMPSCISPSPPSTPQRNILREMPWMLKLCVKLVQPSILEVGKHGALDGAQQVKVEALKIIGYLFSLYIDLHRNYFELIEKLIIKCLDDSDEIIQLHTARVLKSLAESLISPSSYTDKNILFAKSLWLSVLSGPIHSIMQNAKNPILKSTIITCFTHLNAPIFEKLPENVNRYCVTMLLGNTSDINANVRSASVQAIGYLLLIPTLGEDNGFIIDAADSILQCCLDSILSVKMQASWSLSNLCELLINQNSVEAYRIPNSLILKIMKVNLDLTKPEKLRSNAVRSIGFILKYLSSDEAKSPKFNEIIVQSIDVLIKGMTYGFNKGKWNCCYALGNAFQNIYLDSFLASSREFFPTIISVLQSSNNTKVRIAAAHTISEIPNADFFKNYYESTLQELVNCLDCNSDAYATGPKLQHKDNLIVQLCRAILKITGMIEKLEHVSKTAYIFSTNEMLLKKSISIYMSQTNAIGEVAGLDNKFKLMKPISINNEEDINYLAKFFTSLPIDLDSNESKDSTFKSHFKQTFD